MSQHCKTTTGLSTIPHGHAKHWMIAYDIRDKKRLQKVWRFISKEAIPMQYSIYLIQCDRDYLNQIIFKLLEMINTREDDVRIYPLTPVTRMWGLGRQFADDGNVLSDEFLDKITQDNYACQSGTKTHATPLAFGEGGIL